MKHPQHKLVCWHDYAIPVPLDHCWMAMDKCGFWYTYRDEPENAISIWNGTQAISMTDMQDLEPPEPGPWTEQLYYLD